jgi:hypothetical protein
MKLKLALLLFLFLTGAASAQMLLFNGGIQVGTGSSPGTGDSLLLVNAVDHVLLVNATDDLCLAATSSC